MTKEQHMKTLTQERPERTFTAHKPRISLRWGVAALLATALLLTGCSGNVGVGMSVGVPIGNHGYMSVGGGRWL